MHAHIRHLLATPRALLIGAVAAASLAACGGGDGTDLVDTPTYVTWINNANDTVILDWNNDRFAVRRSDRAVISMQDNKVLTGLSVNTNADLVDKGVTVGGVFEGTSTTGSKIAIFKCNNGRSLNIIETSSTYSYSCV